MLPSLSLYNQNTLTDDDFVTTFVARQEVLDTLIRRLRTSDPEGLGANQILIGSRGMGKTSLLRRIGIAIKNDAELTARYIPLNFREEQYNVLSLGDFWRNCGDALAGWAEAAGLNALAKRLDSQLSTKAWRGDDGAAEQFAKEMADLGRRAVLLVDNLDLILNALPQKSHWILRRFLQAKNGPILIGAATHAIKESTDHDAAFYEFFQPHHLEPLNLLETEICMRALSKRRGENGLLVMSVLDQQPERLKTLHTLTAGNPRVLALIYRLLETAESNAAMADLEILLDNVTPYYKARVEEYHTPQQRAVIDAISLHWDPIPTGEISKLTNIATTTLSPLLIRLRKDGLIETVATSGSYSGHQLAERFLNIWYLMRHGTRRTKQKMRWLVEFLSSFYSSRELAEIAQRAGATGLTKTWNADYAFAFEEALGRTKSTIISQKNPDRARRYKANPATNMLQDAASTTEATELTVARTLALEAAECFEKGEIEECRAKLNKIVVQHEVSDDPALAEQAIMALLNTGLTYSSATEYGTAIEIYDTALAKLERATWPEAKILRLQTRLNKAAVQANNGFLDVAGKSLETIIDETSDLSSSRASKLTAQAFLNLAAIACRKDDYSKAIIFYNKIIDLFDKNEELTIEHAEAFIGKALAVGRSGDLNEEISIYTTLLESRPESADTRLLDAISKAQLFKAITLAHKGELDLAIAEYDELIHTYSSVTSISIQKRISHAIANKAIILNNSGNKIEAIKAYDEILERYSNSSNIDLQVEVAKAYICKANIVGEIKDFGSENEIYDMLLERIQDAENSDLREQAATALLNKGYNLGELGNPVSELEVYNDLIDRYGEATEPALRADVGRALYNQALTLGEMNDVPGEIATYENIIGRFNEPTDILEYEAVLGALFNKAVVIANSGDRTRALAAYDELLTRLLASGGTNLIDETTRALFNKGTLLAEMGQAAAAIDVYDELITLASKSNQPELLERIARALVNKGVALGMNDQNEDSVRIFDEVLQRFGNSENTDLTEQVLSAYLNKAVRLGKMGNYLAEIEIYDEVIDRYATSTSPVLLDMVGKAYVNKAVRVGTQSGNSAEIAIYDEIIARFEDLTTDGAQESVVDALLNKAATLASAGDMVTSRALFEQAAERVKGKTKGGEKISRQLLKALTGMAYTLRSVGEIDKAIEVFEQLYEMSKLNGSEDFKEEFDLTRMSLANLVFDTTGDFSRAEKLYLEFQGPLPLVVRANLSWLYLLSGDTAKADEYRASLGDLPRFGLNLLDAAKEIVNDNFGASTSYILAAFEDNASSGEIDFSDDIDRLLSIFDRRGYGERLLTWFDETGLADRIAPIFAAFKAFVTSESALLDVNPEVRGPAKIIYNRLIICRNLSRQHSI
jgi:tetratricopeptide (TPR) repeat protein